MIYPLLTIGISVLRSAQLSLRLYNTVLAFASSFPTAMLYIPRCILVDTIRYFI